MQSASLLARTASTPRQSASARWHTASRIKQTSLRLEQNASCLCKPRPAPRKPPLPTDATRSKWRNEPEEFCWGREPRAPRHQGARQRSNANSPIRPAALSVKPVTGSSGYPTASDEHATDRQARATVARLLAKDWLVQPLSGDDYGRDYLVESIVASQPSGKIFHVQLKGTKSVAFDETGRARWSLETRHLRYYWHRVNEPVFLFLVDVTAEQGWFCFVQRELAGAHAQEKLEEQTTMSLSLRLDYRLSESSRLRTVLDDALSFMREKNPGSLQAALRAAAKDQALIDPHFEVTGAEVENGHTCLKLKAARPFSFSIRVPANAATGVAPKLNELFRYGRPMELTTDEVEFDGLPLFSKAKSDGLRGHLALKPEAKNCEVTVTSASKAHAFSLAMPGKLTSGSDGGLLLAQSNDSPLGIELRLSRESLLAQKAATILFTWDFSKWVGKPLTTLPQIEPVAAFWAALSAGNSIQLTVTQAGNRLVRGKFGRKRLPEIYKGHPLLCEMLRKAREVAIAYRFRTVVPEMDQLLAFDWGEIEVAYGLAREGRYEKPTPELRLYLDPHAGNEKFPELFKHEESEVSGFARLECRPYSIRAFGEVWDLGDAVVETGPVTFHRGAGDDGRPRGELRGQKKTVLWVTKETPVSPEQG